jgi:hypothetical protein
VAFEYVFEHECLSACVCVLENKTCVQRRNGVACMFYFECVHNKRSSMYTRTFYFVYTLEYVHTKQYA